MKAPRTTAGVRHLTIALRRVTTVVSALLVLICVGVAATGCATRPPTAERSTIDRPVLSWWSDPATSIAVSWFDEPAITDVEVLGPGGERAAVSVERDGPVTRALVGGLEPATTYRYRAVSDGEPPKEGWRTFTTAPRSTDAGVENESLAFAVAGDLQPFNSETRRTTRLAMARIASLDPAFILQVGDLTEYGFSRSSWRQAFGALTVAADEIPLVPAAGNHDYYGLPAARFFKQVFPAPYAVGSEVRRNTWYSHTIGQVHVAVLDTEAKGRDAEAQIAWLDQDLQAARARGITWLFISMHRPVLSTGIYAANSYWAEVLLPLAAKHDVAAIFWGHDHIYEHYEYQYGANGYLFDLSHTPASASTHLYTVGTSGARVDALYAGFFGHRPRTFTLEMHERADGQTEELEFEQRSWNPQRVKRASPGIRYQDPEVYPDAASYYSWPFENEADAEAGRYSTDTRFIYADFQPFFGYTYGETSMHYLWVEVRGNRCTISSHYLDGPAGQQGPVITRPDGGEERWVIER